MLEFLKKMGFIFNPFEYLDSDHDERLHLYLVIPKAVEIALLDQPVAILAQPGGGKSALRSYTWRFYQSSRGIKFPIVYIPETYFSRAEHHLDQIVCALARETFLYLISYPDLFSRLPVSLQKKLKRLLLSLPYDLHFLLHGLHDGLSLPEYRQLLGGYGFPGVLTAQAAHHQLFHQLLSTPVSTSKPLTIESAFDLLFEAFGTKSIHLLMDGLDGFIETRTFHKLISWISPLLDKLENWEKKNVYLKLFLPFQYESAPSITNKISSMLQTTALEWDDGLLAEVIRRRIYVASEGAFDSLDAISEPDIRNLELFLARRLPADRKVPRQMILETRKFLAQIAQKGRDKITARELRAYVGEICYA